MPIGSLHDDQIAHFHALARRVDINTFARILEPDLKQILELLLVDSVKPVIVFQFATAAAIGAGNFPGIVVPGHCTAAIAIELNGFVVCIVHTLYHHIQPVHHVAKEDLLVYISFN